MKKLLLSLLLIVPLAIGFSACKGKADSADAGPSQEDTAPAADNKKDVKLTAENAEAELDKVLSELDSLSSGLE